MFELSSISQQTRFFCVPKSRSTNLDLMQTCDRFGHVLWALKQTQGRGRHGRTWHSNENESLTFSLGRCFDSIQSLKGLSLLVGVAGARCLEALGVPVALKWPNDLYVEGKKLGGILIELKPEDQGIWCVIGIGLNLSFEASLDQPITCLANHCSQLPDAELLIRNWILELEALIDRPRAQALALYSQFDVLLEQNIKILNGGEAQVGVGKGIDWDGNLLLETERGLEVINAGEVSVRLYG